MLNISDLFKEFPEDILASAKLFYDATEGMTSYYGVDKSALKDRMIFAYCMGAIDVRNKTLNLPEEAANVARSVATGVQ